MSYSISEEKQLIREEVRALRQSLAPAQVRMAGGLRTGGGQGAGQPVRVARLRRVEEGLATPAEVDRVVKSSFGFRLGAFGPYEIMDQAGADTYLSVFKYLDEKLGKPYFKPPRLLERQVAAGKLGLKTSCGFYDYGAGAADAMRRERDRKFYARLDLVRRELKQDE